VELPSVVTPPPLCVGGVEDSGRGASVVSAKFPPIPLPERNGANSHPAILPSRMPFGADLCPIAGSSLAYPASAPSPHVPLLKPVGRSPLGGAPALPAVRLPAAPPSFRFLCVGRKQWALRDSNPRPQPCESVLRCRIARRPTIAHGLNQGRCRNGKTAHGAKWRYL